MLYFLIFLVAFLLGYFFKDMLHYILNVKTTFKKANEIIEEYNRDILVNKISKNKFKVIDNEQHNK